MKRLKSILFYVIVAVMVLGTTTLTSSCSRKSGCQATEQVGPRTNKKGQLSSKRGKSALFSKKMRKKRRR